MRGDPRPFPPDCGLCKDKSNFNLRESVDARAASATQDYKIHAKIKIQINYDKERATGTTGEASHDA